jgi:hypothetical protein
LPGATHLTTLQVFLASIIIVVYGSLKVVPHHDSLIAARVMSYPLFFGIAAYSVRIVSSECLLAGLLT